jgi:hypothetical protein
MYFVSEALSQDFEFGVITGHAPLIFLVDIPAFS